MGIENESFGRRIARLRIEHGMTQERLANLANVSAQAVSKWENDQSYPDIMLLPVLADVFGVSIDELLGRTAEQHTIAVAQPQPEPEPEPEPQPASEQWPWSTIYAADDTTTPADPPAAPAKATRLHVRIIDKGNEAVNISIPLGAATILRGISHLVGGYTEGIDLEKLVQLANNAEPGTLVNLCDEEDRVMISLE